MKCTVTELEIETIYRRIDELDLNLSPEFQRGEVWSTNKKKKLIDSILRGWRVPPIHLIENKDFIDEVLDGQQRLVAIRDFMQNSFSIDGFLNPEDNRIQKLNKCYYSDLDSSIQRKFKKYSLTIIRLTEYSPEEPAELFFRLNQPVTLTSAEQRNSYIGNTRNQIKNLVHEFENLGANRETIGFSNSRMAYDDIISKFCFTLENESLKKKITSTNISEKYRSDVPFESEIIFEVRNTLSFFIESSIIGREKFVFKKLNINKATLYSWLIFSYRTKDIISKELMAELIYTFEFAREYVKGKEINISLGYEKVSSLFHKHHFLNQMFLIFNQRSSMGSTDALSIIYRDIILEIYSIVYSSEMRRNSVLSDYLENDIESMSRELEKITTELNWGVTLKK